MTIVTIPTCLFALLLAGCSSSRPGLPNIYLSALSYQVPETKNNPAISQTLNSTFSNLAGNASLTVRVGYFGLCIRSSGDDYWSCHRDANSIALGLNATQDPLNLIHSSIAFRDKIVFSGLVYSFMHPVVGSADNSNEITDLSPLPLASLASFCYPPFPAGTMKPMMRQVPFDK